MRNCIVYPKQIVRAGKIREDEDYRIKKVYSDENSIDNLCLQFAIDPDVYGFLIDPNTGTYRFTVFADKKYPYDVINTTLFTYYEIIPRNQTLWIPYSFGYINKTGKRPLGNVLMNAEQDPASLCDSLPTCIGYSGSTLYGTLALTLGYVDDAEFSYFEKKLEHTIIQLGLDNLIILGIVALSIVVLTEIFFLRKLFIRDKITFIRLEMKK